MIEIRYPGPDMQLLLKYVHVDLYLSLLIDWVGIWIYMTAFQDKTWFIILFAFWESIGKKKEKNFKFET